MAKTISSCLSCWTLRAVAYVSVMENYVTLLQ